jgi:hypothetical protein
MCLKRIPEYHGVRYNAYLQNTEELGPMSAMCRMQNIGDGVEFLQGEISMYVLLCIQVAILPNQATQYLVGIILQKPDTYLDELQQILRQQIGVDVSQPTIWRALDRRGYTMKKVWALCTYLNLWDTKTPFRLQKLRWNGMRLYAHGI